MIWYAERGIVPKEKVRKTKGVRAGIQRRTAGQVAARERAREAGEAAAAESLRRQERAEERKRKKAKKKRRGSTPEPGRRGRKIEYIPRNNPSNPFSFSASQEKALKQGHKALDKYKEYRDEWEESLGEDKPNFTKVMKAYDHIENARANFVLAGERNLADKANEIKRDLRHGVIELFKVCAKELRQRRSNPSKGDHQEIAASNMQKANASWAKFCESCNLTDALNTLQHLAIAREEYQHAGDSEGVEQARVKIKLARDAIRKMSKG